jgi:hypothetical protein
LTSLFQRATQSVLWGLLDANDVSDRPEQRSATAAVVDRLGLDSVTSYNSVDHVTSAAKHLR